MSLSPYALGATLYTPAMRDDLFEVASGRKLPQLRSLVICLEDAIGEGEVAEGSARLRRLLDRLDGETERAAAPLIFVRPRHPEMCLELMEWPGIHVIDGLVLPKFDADNFERWQRAVPPDLMLMPILETAAVFDTGAMRELGRALLSDFPEVFALRIGGNDLLARLGLRRQPEVHLYRTPIGTVIHRLLGIFVPMGFDLTAPVCEYFDNPSLLVEEVELDVAFGLVGKTIIHPSQLRSVHRALQVDVDDYEAARAVLAPEAAAVFAHRGAMLEPATHRDWAHRIHVRAMLYGLRGIPMPAVGAFAGV